MGARIYPNLLPQNSTLPAVRYARVAATRVSAMGADPGNAMARFQIDAWAATYDQARAVAAQVRLALQRWRQASAPKIEDTFFVNEIETVEPGAGDQKTFHRVALDFEIHHVDE